MISKKSCIPHESSIRPECVQKIKQARADISDGTGKTYASIDDFSMKVGKPTFILFCLNQPGSSGFFLRGSKHKLSGAYSTIPCGHSGLVPSCVATVSVFSS